MASWHSQSLHLHPDGIDTQQQLLTCTTQGSSGLGSSKQASGKWSADVVYHHPPTAPKETNEENKRNQSRTKPTNKTNKTGSDTHTHNVIPLHARARAASPAPTCTASQQLLASLHQPPTDCNPLITRVRTCRALDLRRDRSRLPLRRSPLRRRRVLKSLPSVAAARLRALPLFPTTTRDTGCPPLVPALVPA